MKKFNVKHVWTKDPVQVCIRGAGGVKLFDASLPAGTSISVVTHPKTMKRKTEK